VDLAEVRQVSSEGLGKILRLQRIVHEAGGQLELCNVHGLLEIFEVPGLQTLLHVYPDDGPKKEIDSALVCRLKPQIAILDGAGVTELENRYEIWWNAQKG
jgi:hypothetical protein